MNDRGSMGRTARLVADEAGLAEAATILQRGGLVAFPTETVYGLGADATNAEAVAGIYAAKERPSFNPLISHLESFEAAKVQGIFDETAQKLAETFWPGPLTLVVPVAPTCTISDLARAGLDSVGLRVPAHPLAHALLKATGRPVAAPSANRSGRVSPTDADHVLGDLDGRIDAVVDGGASDVGVESTIVACLGGTPRLLRPGGVPREAIEALIGQKLESGSEGGEKSPLAPGMLASHYAPRAQVRLNAADIMPGEAAMLFGPKMLPGSEQAKAQLNLSKNGDLKEAAAHLFSYLRQLDASGAHTIAVAPIPEMGLGEAINDRLRRAAAER
ncbi:L-threonylcarbamoyladenylate synthase [Microvirga solisilvae]|uniref:L-threonylcarbamoyladenylate synthase n=1 Tax=Microvirga solisilvae TaxID=2919498 RepID=UPI003C6D46BA